MVSIIIPVYNVGQKLERCMESILCQTVQDYEVLLVDDGSTDGFSGLLCDRYAERYSNVQVFHSANGGAAHARNLGLDHAHGEFILFVDSDDYIPKNHLEILLDLQKKYDTDIVCGGITYVPGPTIAHSEYFCNLSEFLQLILYRDGISDYPFSKLYRKNVFKSARFTPHITSEDFEAFYRFYTPCRRFALTDKTTYFYTQNPGSVSNGGFSPKMLNRIEILDRLMKDIQHDFPEDLPALHSRAVDEAVWLYGMLPKNYTAELAWVDRTIRTYGPDVLKDSRATAKVKRKVRIYLYAPWLWKCRTAAKNLYIRLRAPRA